MKYLTEDQKWVSFYSKFNTGICLDQAGYFDERPQLRTSLTQLLVIAILPFLAFQSMWFLIMFPMILFGWGTVYLKFPIKTGIQDCESASWGIDYHSNRIWIYIGGAGNFDGGRKWKTIRMPWDLEWVRTSTRMPDGWFHETEGNRKSFSDGPDVVGSYEWLKKNRWKEVHPYTDLSDGTVIETTIGVSEMEWRPIWFKWTSLFSLVKRSIDVEFGNEVGKEKGSWKGGCVGCDYPLLPDETPYECLKRMERNRKF